MSHAVVIDAVRTPRGAAKDSGALHAVAPMELLAGALRAAGGEVLITADHGNAEMMLDPESKQAHTAHTLNVVPLVHVGRLAKIADGGALQDIAPTLLRMMGVPQPPEMTGRPLVSFD